MSLYAYGHTTYNAINGDQVVPDIVPNDYVNETEAFIDSAITTNISVLDGTSKSHMAYYISVDDGIDVHYMSSTSINNGLLLYPEMRITHEFKPSIDELIASTQVLKEIKKASLGHLKYKGVNRTRSAITLIPAIGAGTKTRCTKCNMQYIDCQYSEYIHKYLCNNVFYMDYDNLHVHDTVKEISNRYNISSYVDYNSGVNKAITYSRLGLKYKILFLSDIRCVIMDDNRIDGAIQIYNTIKDTGISYSEFFYKLIDKQPLNRGHND